MYTHRLKNVWTSAKSINWWRKPNSRAAREECGRRRRHTWWGTGQEAQEKKGLPGKRSMSEEVQPSQGLQPKLVSPMIRLHLEKESIHIYIYTYIFQLILI